MATVTRKCTPLTLIDAWYYKMTGILSPDFVLLQINCSGTDVTISAVTMVNVLVRSSSCVVNNIATVSSLDTQERVLLSGQLMQGLVCISSGGSRKSSRVVLLVAKPTPAAKRRSLGGSGCMPPQKIFGNIDALRCNLAHS